MSESVSLTIKGGSPFPRFFGESEPTIGNPLRQYDLVDARSRVSRLARKPCNGFRGWMRRVVDQIRHVAFFIANRDSAVDAQKELRKSISEVSKDHKDWLVVARLLTNM